MAVFAYIHKDGEEYCLMVGGDFPTQRHTIRLGTVLALHEEASQIICEQVRKVILCPPKKP